MQFVAPDVSTICIGQAVSASAMLIAAGATGKRYALPHARLLITQPSLEQVSGQATHIGIHAREILRLRSLMSAILAKHTGQSCERIERDFERDLILTPSQALGYGLIDVIQQARANDEMPFAEVAAALNAAALIG
jgi:ATP-dependent Clp protease protease subunit